MTPSTLRVRVPVYYIDSGLTVDPTYFTLRKDSQPFGGGVGVVETLLTNYLYAMSQTIEYLLGESQIPGPQKYVEY